MQNHKIGKKVKHVKAQKNFLYKHGDSIHGGIRFSCDECVFKVI